MPKVHQVAEADLKESSMLDYYVAVRREDNKEFIAGYRFEGYSGNAMWDEIKDIRRAYETNVSYPVIVEW
jgi:hypothetical protein